MTRNLFLNESKYAARRSRRALIWKVERVEPQDLSEIKTIVVSARPREVREDTSPANDITMLMAA